MIIDLDDKLHNDSNDIDAVLQAMIDEINNMHAKRRPAPEHQLNAVQTALEWLDIKQLEGSYGLDRK